MSEKLTLEKYNEISEKNTLALAGYVDEPFDPPHFEDYINENGVLTLPEGITEIGTALLADSSFESVQIPEGVTSIYSGAFLRCENLKDVVIPDSVTYIDDAFVACRNLESVTIGNGIKTIEENAFQYCDALKTITLAPGVSKEIEEQLREEYPNVEIAREPEREKNHEELTLEKWNEIVENHKLYLEDKNQGAHADLQPFVDENGHIEIPEGVKEIPDFMFFGCENVETITIPEGVTSIGLSSFSFCKNLKEINIPEGVTTISYNAFAFCVNLESIAIPEGVTKIEFNAFENCVNLKSVTIPETVTAIEEYAFADCESLTDVTIPGSVTAIGKGVFAGCDNLESVTIPKSVNFIDINAFAGCEKLSEIILEPGVSKEIEEQLREEYPNIKVTREGIDIDTPQLSETEVATFTDFYSKLVEQLESGSKTESYSLDGVKLVGERLACSDIIVIKAENADGELIPLTTFTPDGFGEIGIADLGHDDGSIGKDNISADDIGTNDVGDDDDNRS